MLKDYDDKNHRSKSQIDMSNTAEQIENLRRRIDECDRELVRLLNDRAMCALEIGRLKQLLGLKAHQPVREIKVLEHARSRTTGPLDDEAITRVFERIIDESRRLEEKDKR